MFDIRGVDYRRLPLCGLLLLGLSLLTAPASGSEWRLITATDEKVIFDFTPPVPVTEEVIVDRVSYTSISCGNYDNILTQGLPSLPIAQVMLALPPGCVAVATVIELEEAVLGEGLPLPHPIEQFLDLPLSGDSDFPAVDAGSESMPTRFLTYAPDPVIYEGVDLFPALAVKAEAGIGWRFLQVTPVQIHPVRFDPARGQLIWYPRMRIQVNFVHSGAARPEAGELPYPVDEDRWESIYKRTILNYERSRSYKRLPRATLRVMKQSAGESDGADFAVRMKIPTTDLYRVSYDNLSDSGAFSGPQAWDDLAIVVRSFDDTRVENPHREISIAWYAEDNDSDGEFGAGDAIIFYGEDSWDYFDLDPAGKRFGRANIYWLIGGGASAGIRMNELPDWYEVPSLIPVTASEQVIHFEEDHHFGSYRLVDDAGDIQPGPYSVRVDHYNWTDPSPNPAESIQAIELNLPRIESISRIDVFIQAMEGKIPWNRFRLWLSRTDNVELASLSLADTAWAFPAGLDQVPNKDNKQVTVTEGFENYDEWSGRNYLKIYTPYQTDSLDGLDGQGAGINWVEITCNVDFRLSGGRLLTQHEGDGIEEYRFKSLVDQDLYLFDITDPSALARIPISDGRFSLSGSRWNLNVQIDFGAETTTRRHLLIETDGITEIPPADLRVQNNDPLPDFGGEDMVVIYPLRFYEALEPLLSYRISQGHSIYPVPVTALYDTYSGGKPHPFAIKRLLKTMWTQSDPRPDYLLLVGDGSNDIAGYIGVSEGGYSDSTYIPVVTVVGHVSGSNGYELASCDHWYIDNLAGDWFANMTTLPDMHVGRIPCGTEEELRTYVDKVIDYEQNDVTATWRNRIIVHSDDSFSIGPYGYGVRSTDRNFDTISDLCLDAASSDLAFDHYDLVPFYHSDIMDSVLALGRCLPDTLNPDHCQRYIDGSVVLVNDALSDDLKLQNELYGASTVKDNLIDSINRGALVWAYQGHSMRKLISHEYVFQHALNRTRDVFELTNNNRPFFFIGAGCHLGDFSHHNEAHTSLGGDAMAEVMLFCCDGESKGAIAVLGSTDYESIGHRIELHLFEAMFNSPPEIIENDQAVVRWRLGELITQGKLFVSETARRQRVTYTLLGDPALRMGVSPPVMNLTLNNEVWDPTLSAEYISTRPDDSLTVSIQAYDESTIPLPVIEDYYGTVPPDSVRVLEQASAGRHLRISYRTLLQRHPYSITITAHDRTGTTREVTIAIPLEAVFYEKAGASQTELTQGASLSGSSSIVVGIRAGTHLSPDDFKLSANDQELILIDSEETQENSGPLAWRLEYENLNDFPVGPLELVLQVRQREGDYVTISELPLEIGLDDLRFKSVWWIPSPFTEESTLVYDLSQPAARVRVRIYTASGRCILKQESDGGGGDNLYPPLPTGKGVIRFDAPVWNGRDDDGDPVANGLYFFELTAWDAEGKIAHTVLDKLIRAK